MGSLSPGCHCIAKGVDLRGMMAELFARATGRLVVIDEAPPRCGIAADVAALCVDLGFDPLEAPVKRVTAPHVLAAVREMG